MNLLVFFSLVTFIKVHQTSCVENGTRMSAAQVGRFFDPTKLVDMPRGCQCKDKVLVSMGLKCHSFDCICQCDTTKDKCDYNCCCDSDCNVGERYRFSMVCDKHRGLPEAERPLQCSERGNFTSIDDLPAKTIDDATEVSRFFLKAIFVLRSLELFN